MTMPGTSLTPGRILFLGSKIGKRPGKQRRETGPERHREVRGKCSAAGSWGAVPSARRVAAD